MVIEWMDEFQQLTIALFTASAAETCDYCSVMQLFNTRLASDPRRASSYTLTTAIPQRQHTQPPALN
jgi:hypothetical protein